MSCTQLCARLAPIAGIAAVAGMLFAGLGTPAPTHAAGRILPRASHALLSKADVYVIVSLTPGTANSMVVRDSVTSDPPITVTLGPTAKIVRRYDGKSSFAELSVNDRVNVWPAAVAGTQSITATTPISGSQPLVTRVKDLSIQVAYTQIAGKITAISADKTQLSVLVTANKGSNKAAFMVQQNVTLNVTASTPVYLGKKAGTVADLQPGMVIRTWGLSDAVTGVMSAPHAIHVVPQKAAGQTDTGTTTDNGTSV